MIQIKNAEHFFEIQKQIKKIPFTQSEGWYKSERLKNTNIHFFVDNEKEVKIAAWGREYKVPFTKKKLLLFKGEALSENIEEKSVIDFYRELTKLDFDGIEIDSNTKYNVDFEIGLRRSGFVRPIGFFSCPLTINFQVQDEHNFNRNWKRNVKKALASELIFEEKKSITEEIKRSIISMFKEMASLKKLGYQIEQESLTYLLNSSQMRLFIVYDKQQRPIAARIIHDNKPFSSDVYAANSIKARDNGATYFMMQKIFEKLKEENYMEFDFGRIPPSNHATDSVYAFKNASRGDRIQYNGEWSCFKSKRLELLLFFYKTFKIKKQRY